MRLVISDTNILIDIEDGNLTFAIFQLPYEIVVPDILFEAELRKQHKYLLEAGLKLKSLSPKSVEKAASLMESYPRAGRMDHFALALALQEHCPLLTGDRELRHAAKLEEVEVHGTIWVIDELMKHKLIDVTQAGNSFEAMRAKGSRLPAGEIDKLMSKWELATANNDKLVST